MTKLCILLLVPSKRFVQFKLILPRFIDIFAMQKRNFSYMNTLKRYTAVIYIYATITLCPMSPVRNINNDNKHLYPVSSCIIMEKPSKLQYVLCIKLNRYTRGRNIAHGALGTDYITLDECQFWFHLYELRQTMSNGKEFKWTIQNENRCLQRESNQQPLAFQSVALDHSASTDGSFVAFKNLRQSRHMTKSTRGNTCIILISFLSTRARFCK